MLDRFSPFSPPRNRTNSQCPMPELLTLIFLFSIQPSENTTIVVQVQATTSSPQSLEPLAWTKIILFDDHLRLVSGKWKLPLRRMPMRPDILPRDLNTIPQVVNNWKIIFNHKPPSFHHHFEINTLNNTFGESRRSTHYFFPKKSAFEKQE